MEVFIIGIAGGTGSRVAKELIQLGDGVTGLYRRVQQIDMIKGIGAIGVQGDIAKISEDELAEAMADTEAVVFTAGAGDQDSDAMIDAIDEGGVKKTIAAMKIAGKRRLVLVSVFPEAWRERGLGEPFEHYMRAKKNADIAVVQSGLDWIIVRPSALQDDAGKGTVTLGLAAVHTEIARDDVAATIVALLHTPDLHRRILELTEGDTPIADAVTALLADSM